MKYRSALPSFSKILFTVLMSVMIASCSDLIPYDELDSSGTVNPELTLQFEPSASALTRGTDGNAIKNIQTLSIILYNANDGSLYKVFNFEEGQFTANDIDRPAGGLPDDYGIGLPDGTDAQPAEAQTPQVQLTLRSVPVGTYRMYAVANMGALSDAQVESEDALKSIRLTWDSAHIAQNNQMFGYIANGTTSNSNGFNAPDATVDRNHLQFHAWLKRAASKVTIVYDGSGLHEDIFVYIHKVTICDLPRQCYLGRQNRVGDSTHLDVRADADLLKRGETIYYTRNDVATNDDPGTGYQSWMRIGKGSAKKGAVRNSGTDLVCHHEDDMALYFYENVQGNFSDKTLYSDTVKYWKPQIWDNVGQNVTEGMEDYKDNIANGTYIEVEGFYVSKHSPGVSQGPIKYRFMLGQDTKYDYNAFRNRHYKLTLQFKGYANQPDWHIEYIEETPDVLPPDELYVSYLYNKRSDFPLRIIGNCTSLKVEIVQNDWHPCDTTQADGVPRDSIYNAQEPFTWNREVWENNINKGKQYTKPFGNNTSGASTNEAGYYYGRHKYSCKTNKGKDSTLYITPPHAGFLSLTVPTNCQDESKELPAAIFNTSADFYYYGTASIEPLRKFYYGLGGNGSASATNYDYNGLAQDHRDLNISSDGTKGSGRNRYSVQTVSDGSKLITLPLWTRPLSMIRISGFSGNNPYEAYQRKAMLQITATFKLQNGDVTTIHRLVPVYQVRRIINPKAIWRSEEENDDFRVKLMQRRDASKSEFEAFQSEGPWRAEIITFSNSSNHFIELSPGPKSTKEGDAIVGITDTDIDFYINFKNSTAAGTSNCAIIRILYHGLTTEHTIFVRQGYDQPLEIVSGKGKWSSYALYAARHNNNVGHEDNNVPTIGVLTKSPLALGSFFKRGNYDEALITSNNIGSTGRGKNVDPDGYSFQLHRWNQAGTGVESSSKKWYQIQGVPYNNHSSQTNPVPANATYEWRNFTIKKNGVNRIYSLPTMEQYQALADEADVGFGVLYGDGATTVATSFDDAFGYLDGENNGPKLIKGMRGVISYNATNAHQIFFPVGYSGVGRRTIQGTGGDNKKHGVLRYGAVDNLLTVAANPNNQYRPICYNLPNNAGAIYWAKKVRMTKNYKNEIVPDGTLAWDMNFADLNFSPYDYACAFGNQNGTGGKFGDALPIKLVLVEN